MSSEKITNNLEKCRECNENISTLFCKECNCYLCQKCWELIHNSLTSHNILKSHLPPLQLVIPIRDILSILQFNKIIRYDGKFRNGFHDPNDPLNIVSSPNGNHTSILCDKSLKNGYIYEIKFKIRKGHEDGKGCWTMFGVAKDELHGQHWNYNKSGFFYHSYNNKPYCDGVDGGNLTNFHSEGFKRFQPNDIVTIIADLNRAELGVRINDINIGIIFSGLPMGVPLYPAISPYGKNEEIELLY